MKCPRLLVVALCVGFAFLPLLFGQKSPTRPKKILTPEQKAYQQQWNAWFSKHQNLQAQARRVFDTEMAREKAGDCRGPQSTYSFTNCFGNQATITDQNLKSYEAIIGKLIVPPPQWPGQSTTNMRGPAGPILTPEQVTAEFEGVEQSWRQYRELACTAAYDQFGGGSGGPAFKLECGLKLARNHMRELNMIYEGDLRR